MMLKTFDLSIAGSNRVAVAVARSREEAERLAKINSSNRNWTSIEEVRWRDEYHAQFFGGRCPTGDSYCERNHPHDKVASQ
jgi:hypothetical protein